MTSKLTNSLLILIVVLLATNILMSTKIYEQVSSSDLVLDEEAAFDDLEAKLWGDKVVALYNGQKHQALYDLFHQQAKVKITEERLAKQLAKLHELFGDIEQIAFTNLIKLGEKNSEVYYQLLFNARVSQTESRQATMTLSLIVEKDDASLYGFKLNARQSLD